jgi:hypothetical protein
MTPFGWAFFAMQNSLTGGSFSNRIDYYALNVGYMMELNDGTSAAKRYHLLKIVEANRTTLWVFWRS